MTDDTSYSVTADDLRQFVERLEQLDAKTRYVAEQRKECMAEAKGRGYSPAIIRSLPPSPPARQAAPHRVYPAPGHRKPRRRNSPARGGA